MRKLILLGLLAIFMSILASPVVAGCEDELVDASPGLYGLCIAYHNAGNANAMYRILMNYNKKRDPNVDPLMPGTGEFDPCPCWPGDEMANANLISSAHECHLSSDPISAVYGSATNADVSFVVVNDLCLYSGTEVPDLGVGDLAPDSEQACRDGILALADDFGGEENCT